MHLDAQVTGCVQALNRGMPRIARAYSPRVIVLALFLQLEAALAAAIKARQISRKEGDAMIQRLAGVTFC